MGMDVIGNSPISERGEYFRNNIWWWHPLWEYCESVAPDIIPASNLGHMNEGWGLGRGAALALADRLAQAIASGETQQFEQDFKARLQEFPPLPCTTCGATGRRAEPPQTGPGNIPCNGCQGTGRVPDIRTWYGFSVENVREFEAFLRECGGFEIH